MRCGLQGQYCITVLYLYAILYNFALSIGLQLPLIAYVFYLLASLEDVKILIETEVANKVAYITMVGFHSLLCYFSSQPIDGSNIKLDQQ